MFKLFRAYSDGYLPEEGALSDQTNIVVECFDEISLAKGVLDKEDLDKDAGNNPSNNDGDWKTKLGM